MFTSTAVLYYLSGSTVLWLTQVTQTADETLVAREITLDKANGNPQAIDLGTGNLLPPPAVPAGGEPAPQKRGKLNVDDKNYDAWAVEVKGMGDDYGFEFSPQHLAAERRVTLWCRSQRPTSLFTCLCFRRGSSNSSSSSSSGGGGGSQQRR